MPQLDASRLSSLIDLAYEAAVRPELWRGLLAQIADVAGAPGALLLGTPTSGSIPIGSESMDETVEVGVRTGWLTEKCLPLARALSEFDQGHDIVMERMVFSPWEIDHHRFTVEYTIPLKINVGAAIRLAGQGRNSLVLDLPGDLGSEPLSDHKAATMLALLPHLRRAGQLTVRVMTSYQEGLLDALAAFECGALLLDRRGRVVRMNAKAEAMMGVGIAVRGGTLTATGRECDGALQNLIGSVIARGTLYEAEPVGGVALARPGAAPLLVHGAPVARSAADLFQQARAILTIDDPDARQAPHAQILRQVFGLTGAEAAIAIALANGSDIEEIARMRGVSVGTLRNQVKTVFAKTDTSRQAELVAKLMRYAKAA